MPVTLMNVGLKTQFPNDLKILSRSLQNKIKKTLKIRGNGA